MTKFHIIFWAIIAIVIVQGAPQSPFDDIVQAAKAGNWDHVQSLLYSRFGSDGWKPAPLSNIRNLRPVEGGHVYGESEYTVYSSSDQNGRKIEDGGGHKVINHDGAVKEFDFKPNFQQNPFFKLTS